MANLAVFASGNGSNFEAIVHALQNTPHRVVCLISDQPKAFALDRAKRLGIPVHVFRFRTPAERETSEKGILEVLKNYKTDLIALAGFMRVLSPLFVDAYPKRIVNIHPSLLPKYPGVHGIRDSFLSRDPELGITIHYVDYGVDSGPIILQRSFKRAGTESLEEIEERIHRLEHEEYPRVLLQLLDSLEQDFHKESFKGKGVHT